MGPDRKLAKFLSQAKDGSGARKDTPKRFIVTPRELFVKASQAWNAWRANTPVELRYSAFIKQPTFN